MTTLLVDIGNTRVKWALLRGARLARMQARAHARRVAVLRAVVRAAPRDVERVIAVCVAGATLERALGAAVRRRFGVRVEFVRSARRAAGVRNGYRDTWRLGADRWVGVIAAHASGAWPPGIGRQHWYGVDHRRGQPQRPASGRRHRARSRPR